MGIMNRVGAAGPVTLGLDVSHYQGKCDFQFLKSLAALFVFSKCTEYNVDDTYASDRASAIANGILFGGYDYFHPSRDAATQAKFFLDMAKPKSGDLVPFIDTETLDSLPAKNLAGELQKWLDIVEAAIKAIPGIYLGPYFGQSLALPSSFKRYPLIIAHYGTDKPLVPPPWATWAIHQYTDKGGLRGIPGGREDLDRFNGTYDQLLKLRIP